jgi:hypothetical protein
VWLFSASAGVPSRSAIRISERNKPVLILAIALAWPAPPRAQGLRLAGDLSRCFEVELDVSTRLLSVDLAFRRTGSRHRATMAAMPAMPCHAIPPFRTHLCFCCQPANDKSRSPQSNPMFSPQLLRTPGPTGGDPQHAINVVIRFRSSPGTRCWA